MQNRIIGLEQFLEIVLPQIADQEREIVGEFDVIVGTHPTFGRVSAIQGATSAVLITSEH